MSMWPSVILHFLFTLPPSSFLAMSVASFLYGNGVPCAMAIRLAQVCNATPTDTLQTQIHALYIAWTKSSKLHLTMYWNMRLQSFVWLNALIWPQNEVWVVLTTIS